MSPVFSKEINLKLSWFVFLLSASVLLLLLALRMVSSRAAEVVFVAPAVRRVGIVDPEQQEYVEVEFEVHNKTSKSVCIVKTMTSCACSELRTESFQISPSGLTKVHMKIKTKGLRGHHEISSYIYTDSLDFPSFQLLATCDFSLNGRISPLNINMPKVTVGSDIRWDYRIHINDISIENLFPATFENPLQVSFSNSSEDVGFCKLTFTGTAPIIEGLYSYPMEVQFKGVEGRTQATAYLSVTKRFQGPAEVNFGVIEGGKKGIETIKIVDFFGLPFSIKEVSSSLANIEKRYVDDELTVELTPLSPDEFLSSEMIVSVVSDDGSISNMEIPFRARVLWPKIEKEEER